MEDTTIRLDDEDMDDIVGGKQHRRDSVPMNRLDPDQARAGAAPTGPQYAIKRDDKELAEAMQRLVKENVTPE
ncbi:hypothetical protein LJB81_01770 [Desulfovibrio sp. OttesenSCG-928-M14]|nr:hypothetical protein [Desulfovibrio sp. OttesenSCG-928-M14]